MKIADFESMQGKCADGLREACRALKTGGSRLYSALNVMGGENTARWRKLIAEANDPDLRARRQRT